jgi:ADP-ribose pyrophosphatase YjhB (NUDIX family)
VLNYRGKVLVIKNWLGREHWALPGGGISSNENPKDAAIRELNEELGLKLNNNQLKLAGEGHWRTDNLGHYYYVFVANRYFKHINPKRLEITEAKWIFAKDLNSSNTSLEVLQAVSNVKN